MPESDSVTQDENYKLKQERDFLFAELASVKDEKREIERKHIETVKRFNRYKSLLRYKISIKKDFNKSLSRAKTALTSIKVKTWLAILTFAFIGIETFILLNQNNIMQKQNELFKIQNEKVEQQNQLIESQRRSSYVFLLGNIMDAVNVELSLRQNKNRSISSHLKGEIIALSNSLTPYKFILEDTIKLNSLSPERGMLLVFLLEADINKSDLNDIFKSATFDNAYISKLSIKF